MLPPPDTATVLKAFRSLPHCAFLGMELVDIGPGRGTARLAYDDRFVGNPATGVVHGGLITTVLDTLSGFAAMTAVPAGTAIATLDLRIDYLKPARPGQVILAEARCIRVTSTVAFVRSVAFHNTPEDAIAHGTGTFMLGATGFSVAPDRPGGGDQPC